MNREISETPTLPRELNALVEALEGSRHQTWWVGEGLLEALTSIEQETCSLKTTATPKEITQLFPQAIQICADPTLFMIPTGDGPVELSSLEPKKSIEGDLSHRGFSVLAMALRVRDQSLVDPYGGLDDLRARRLVGTPDFQRPSRVAPQLVFTAARLIARFGFEIEANSQSALAQAWSEKQRIVDPAWIRRELKSLLQMEAPSTGIRFLEVAGVAAQLGIFYQADTANMIDQTRPDPALRWAVWLRQSKGANRVLRRIRMDYKSAERIGTLLRYHPIDEAVTSRSRTSLRRASQKLSPDERSFLIDLREREIDAQGQELPQGEAIRSKLKTLRLGFEVTESERIRLQQRVALELDGRAIMEKLGCEPGPQVGQALRHLQDQVDKEPALNRPDTLQVLLEAWWKQRTSAMED